MSSSVPPPSVLIVEVRDLGFELWVDESRRGTVMKLEHAVIIAKRLAEPLRCGVWLRPNGSANHVPVGEWTAAGWVDLR